jgi:hypothetical protein
MRQRTRLPLLLACVAVLGGCVAHQTPYRPFKIPERDFYGTVKTIALAPLLLPNDTEDPDAIRAKFEPLIEAKLREAGFVTIPPGRYDEIWKQMASEVGGIFDPTTGKADDGKFNTIRDHTYRELASQFEAGAVLHSAIQIVRASFNGTSASWHGTTESTSTAQTGFARFMEAFSSGGTHGSTAALSLGVVIRDINGTEVYSQWGGIQLITKVVSRSFVTVPQSELFRDDARNSAAVDVALRELIVEAPKAAAQSDGKGVD